MNEVVFETYAGQWAIEPAKMDEIRHFVHLRSQGLQMSPNEISAALSASTNFSGGRVSVDEESVAVIPLVGTLMNRGGMLSRMSGATSTQAFAQRVREAAANDEVETVVLDIDSPGGRVSGIANAAAAVREAAASKRVVAVANDMMASGAYWIASQADRIVVSETSMVGSIGVLLVHQDRSARDEDEGFTTTVLHAGERKAEGNPYEPLSADDLQNIQAELDATHQLFIRTVAAGRGREVSAIREVADGSVFTGQEAIAAGLADEIGTISSTINHYITHGTMDNVETTDETAGGTLGGSADEKLDAILAATRALQETVTAQAERIEALERSEQQAEVREAEALVDAAIRRGKIETDRRDSLVTLAQEQPGLVKDVLGAVQPNSTAPLTEAIDGSDYERRDPGAGLPDDDPTVQEVRHLMMMD